MRTVILVATLSLALKRISILGDVMSDYIRETTIVAEDGVKRHKVKVMMSFILHTHHVLITHLIQPTQIMIGAISTDYDVCQYHMKTGYSNTRSLYDI